MSYLLGPIPNLSPRFRATVCTTPNGRTDGHGAYIRRHPTTGAVTCAFCGEVVT